MKTPSAQDALAFEISRLRLELENGKFLVRRALRDGDPEYIALAVVWATRAPGLGRDDGADVCVQG